MKHIFQTLLEDTGYGETQSYSGKGMYGKECLGVALDGDNNVGGLVSCVIECLHDRVGDTAFDDEESIVELDGLFSEARWAFRHMNQDSMGLGIIVYFPRIPYTEEDQ